MFQKPIYLQAKIGLSAIPFTDKLWAEKTGYKQQCLLPFWRERGITAIIFQH